MKVLIIGGGGREHALAWKAAQSPKVKQVFVAPGNAGTAHEAKTGNVPIAADAVPELLAFARDEAIDLTIVGPEAPLVAGVVDAFQRAGLRCFGPSKAAAQLEGSKAYAKDFLARHRIPTAAYRNFTDVEAAVAYIREQGAPIVVKADGLAAGKGVILAQTEDEAVAAVRDMLAGNAFGAAGHRVVVEEFLKGEEASFIVMVDGKHILPMATSQDHKARDNGDRGPNTGGMGAYSPAPALTPALHAKAMREIIQPVVRGMQAEGKPYTGFLYAGLMITPGGELKTLEFNCRLGDPETQPILMRLKSDLLSLVEHAVNGTLDQAQAQWDRRVALGVVLAAEGYPNDPRKGDEITGIPKPQEDLHVFHAGTRLEDGKVLTNGGRILCVTALGDTVRVAQRRAYEVAEQIQFAGKQMRRDIGYRAIAAKRTPL